MNQTPEYTITKNDIEISVDDEVIAYRLYAKSKYGPSRYFPVFLAFVFLFIFIFAVTSPNGKLIAIFTFIFSAYLLYFHFGLKFRIRRHRKKIEKNMDKNKDYKYTYVMSETGFSETGNNYNAFYNWEYFSDAIMSEKMILLITTGNFRIFTKSNYSGYEFEQLKKWISGRINLIGEDDFPS